MRTPFRRFPASIGYIVSSIVFKWIGRKRGEASAAIAAITLFDIVWGKAESIDLLEPSGSVLFTLSWMLLLTGVVIRIWAAGNLEKNREITTVGIYRMVRHPLYLATSLMYLAYFLAFGDALLGVPLFVAMLLLIYWPRILHEEETLLRRFPSDIPRYRTIPRLMPNLRLLCAAFHSDRFSLQRAYQNLGMRSIGALLLVPLLLEVLIKLKRGR